MKANTTFRNENLFCLNCGGEFALNYPISIKEMTEKIEAFNNLHKNCKKTWEEPKVDKNKSVHDRAMWWFEVSERGLSSMTMWNCFMGNKGFSIHHPSDPSDFGRCWKLLETVPEWKKELYKLKSLSPIWSNLVDNWDKLNEYYEKMREKKGDNGMYEFMRSLIENKKK